MKSLTAWLYFPALAVKRAELEQAGAHSLGPAVLSRGVDPVVCFVSLFVKLYVIFIYAYYNLHFIIHSS